MIRLSLITAVSVAILLAACGSDDGLGCDLGDAVPLAETDWPKDRHDPANTARVEGVIPTDQPTAQCIFPIGDAATVSGDAGVQDCEVGSPITTSAIVGEDRLILVTQDGRLRQLNFDGSVINTEFENDLPAAASTPLLGSDQSTYLTDLTGVTRRFEAADGEQLFTASLLDEVVIALNMGPDGVVYTGTVNGLFVGICTNGGFRFSGSLGAITIPAAVTNNPTDPDEVVVLVASNSGRITAVEDDEGDLLWTFFTSGRLDQSGIVIDERKGMFIVPDSQGLVFAISVADGLPRLGGADLIPYRAARCIPSLDPCLRNSDCSVGEICSSETISAPGALGEEQFFLATEGIRSESGVIRSTGAVYAFSLDFAGGGPDWVWSLPEEGIIQSAPIVLAQGDEELIIFGADLDCQGTICSRSAIFALSEENQCIQKPECEDRECMLSGESCESDADCTADETCSPEGQLQWRVDLPDPVATSSLSVRNVRLFPEQCQLDIDCRNGATCSLDGTCSEQCRSDNDSDCADDRYCEQLTGLCSEKCLSDTDCGESASCETDSGHCVSGSLLYIGTSAGKLYEIGQMAGAASQGQGR